MKKAIVLITISICFFKCYAQTVPVGSYAESLERMAQILGTKSDSMSFCQRPINIWSPFGSNSTLLEMISSKNLSPQLLVLNVPVIFKVLPFNWVNEYNSKLPFGYNKAPFFPNVGYQTMVSGGFFLKIGMFNIQLKPEMVYAQNKYFPTFTDIQASNKSTVVSTFFYMVNGIDAPERFGTNSLQKILPGQSKITIIYHNVEIGVSTENLWWGPGVQNSIMMSNTAPGFLHWTLNSSNPLKTPIGNIEYQVIGGELKQSGFLPYVPGKLMYDPGYYIPKPVVKRYVSAFTANWHPKWIDGLYLGLSAYDYLNIDSSYRNNNIIKRIFPVFTGSSNLANSFTNGDGQDFAYALNLRQVLPKYNMEIYLDWARNDRAANATLFILEPEASSAYTIGGSRYFNITEKQYLKIGFELTHLQAPENFLVGAEPTWYVHPTNPRDGYTNQGRVIGAGIGPGSNSQILDVCYISGLNSLGIKLEKLNHNNDLYEFAAANGVTNHSPPWTDYSGTIYGKLCYKQYLIQADLSPVVAKNYEYSSGNNMFNLHTQISLSYLFK